ncbi:unnamed protein product [Zymoseptoria tritici ST99CH_1E4]|uniref:Uncharacterized protein n=1 Tax=Zymoseptoria tritici ST99CH_1E4 TaxID=1276532 RepID=A0A2H1H9E4_ZYMTR|nr:unnamed protein product [Zymoseptoria tritici ST99CH_1E4]
MPCTGIEYCDVDSHVLVHPMQQLQRAPRGNMVHESRIYVLAHGSRPDIAARDTSLRKRYLWSRPSPPLTPLSPPPPPPSSLAPPTPHPHPLLTQLHSHLQDAAATSANIAKIVIITNIAPLGALAEA